MAAGNSAICDIAGGHRSCEKIACTTCQMSNVCCAMFNVVVKAPGHFVSGSFYKFIGHRTTDIRYLTVLAVVNFFTAPQSAHTAVAVVALTIALYARPRHSSPFVFLFGRNL